MNLLFALIASLPFKLETTCVEKRSEWHRVCEENTHGLAGCGAGLLWGGPIGCAVGALVGSSVDTGKCYDKESLVCLRWVTEHVRNPQFTTGLP